MKNLIWLFALVALVFGGSGCSTVVAHGAGKGGPYAGTRFAARGIAEGLGSGDPTLPALMAADLPLGVAADTLLLPITTVSALTGTSSEKSKLPYLLMVPVVAGALAP